MKRTRNVFVLIGEENLFSPLFEQLQFKGIIHLSSEELTEDAISEVFRNNKSVLCFGKVPATFEDRVIPVPVIKWVDGILTPELPLGINVAREDVAQQFERISNFLNLDIGDHKSNDSGANGIPSISDCGYCKYLHGEQKTPQQTVYHSKHFYVVPTFGEFAHGYLLIIPYRHIMSFAELNNDERDEFPKVLSDVKEILRLTYGVDKFLVWENGTGNGGKGKASDSVVHAHLHIAPSNTVNADVIQGHLGAELVSIKYKDFPIYGNHSYLLVEGSNGIWRINDNPNLYIPRQYVRQLLALEYGFTDDKSWNWRICPFWDKIIETLEHTRKALILHKDELSERIITNTRDFLEE